MEANSNERPEANSNERPRRIIHLNLTNLTSLKLITNKEYLQSGGEVDIELKLLKVNNQEQLDAFENPTQWQLAQAYAKHYDMSKELVLVLTIPYQSAFFTKAYVVELLPK